MSVEYIGMGAEGGCWTCGEGACSRDCLAVGRFLPGVNRLYCGSGLAREDGLSGG
jgi:hypothetical protein